MAGKGQGIGRPTYLDINQGYLRVPQSQGGAFFLDYPSRSKVASYV